MLVTPRREIIVTKALVFTDLHIHAHKDCTNRLQNCLQVLDWVFKEADARNCEHIFFLGDLFHERSKIDVLNYLKTFEVFMEHMIGDASGRKAHLLVGNHDMYHKERWDVNSVKPLSAIPNVEIIQSPSTFKIGGRRIDWLPHTDNPIKELDKLKKENNGAGDILLAHLAVHGAMTNVFYGTKSDVIVEYDNDMMPVSVDVFQDWQMTLLGHYHGAQQLNDKVEYVGSPLQLSFGEAFQQKHVIVLDLETLEKEYIVNEFSPQHLIVSPQDIEHEAYDFNDKFVRLEVDDLSQREVIDLQQKVSKNYKPLSLGTKNKEKKTDQDEASLETSRTVMNNIDDILECWIKDKGVPEGLDESYLLKIGKMCLDSNSVK